MEVLGDDNRIGNAEDRRGAVTAIISTHAIIVENDGFVGHAERQGIAAHGFGFIVVRCTSIAGHDQAIDFAINVNTENLYEGVESGDIGYHDAMKKIHAMEAGAGVVEGFQDVYQDLPPETRTGSGDPRIPLEMVADAEGLKLLARAGYDPQQAGEAWRRTRKALESAKRSDTEALAMAMMPPMLRKMSRGIENPLGGVSAEALTRTLSQNPPDRAAFLDSMARSREITTLTSGKKLTIGKESFNRAVGGYMLADARRAYEEGDWTSARKLYQTAWDAGFQTAEVATALGEAQLGGFAFAATEQEKTRAENYMLKAVKLDKRSPAPYKALGELYGEWDRYEEAVVMYRKYLKLSPDARDRSRIERQIRKLERKAGR